MKDPENGEEMKDEAPEGEEAEELSGEEAGGVSGEESPKEAALESLEEAAEEAAESITEEAEEEMLIGIEAPARPGEVKLSRPLIAGGIAVIALSWVAIIILALLLATDGNQDTSGIDELVQGYFQAVEENRQADVYAMYDPDDLSGMAESFGMSVEDFLAYAQESAADASMAVDFDGLTYEIGFEDIAVVTITGGTYTMNDEEGNPVTEEISPEGNPVEIEMVNKDGKWYMKMPGQ